MFQIKDYDSIAKKRLLINILNICFFVLLLLLVISTPSFESIYFGILCTISIFGMQQLSRKLDKNIGKKREDKIIFSCLNKDFNQRNNGLMVHLTVIAFSFTFISGISESYFKKSSSNIIFIVLITIIVLLLLMMIMVLGFYGMRCYVFDNKIVTVQGVMNFSDIKKYQLILLNNGKVQFEANTGEQYVKLKINNNQSKIVESIIKNNCIIQ
ncbi:hypothetical protein [Vallitalea maricola]|uniref:Uncharacterized protein n=1 Tax=Vallitalea maricola TaxID=3074433 RepID=A0ACB5UNF5_9FIRM|nr:hypothetical protein AN2V17_37330 [Vallitalea sp. AN17-2]